MAAGYHYGVKLRITPTGLSPASAAASLAALPRPALPGVFGRTDLSATLTARPVPRGIPVGACHTTDGASRVASSFLFHACQRQYPGGSGQCFHRSLPGRHRSSPFPRRVDSHIARFGACSAFYGLFLVMRCTSPIPLWNRGQAAFPQRITVADQVAIVGVSVGKEIRQCSDSTICSSEPTRFSGILLLR